MESIASTTSSTAGQRPIPHDLPVVPGSPDAKLQAVIDAWDNRIPTAAAAPVSLNRAQLDTAIANSADDEPVIPTIPGQRKPSAAYNAIVLGQPHAWTAF